MRLFVEQLIPARIILFIFALLAVNLSYAQIEIDGEEDSGDAGDTIDCPEIEALSIPTFYEDYVLFEWDDVADTEYLITITYNEPADADSGVEDVAVMGDGTGNVSFEWMPESGVENFTVSIQFYCSDGSLIDYSVEVERGPEIETVEHVINPVSPGNFPVSGKVMTNCNYYHCVFSNAVDVFVFYTIFPSGTRVQSYETTTVCDFAGNLINQTGGADVKDVIRALRSAPQTRGYGGFLVQDKCQNNSLRLESQTTQVDLYPNPVTQFATIGYETVSEEQVLINIYNNNGQVVKSIHTNNSQSLGKFTQSFDATDLNPGIYYIQVKEGAIFQELTPFIKVNP